MKRVRHSRSGLFLIELMICILFFSITAGICIQFFVKSHNMSQDAKNLYQAQQEAASMAEILEKLPSHLRSQLLHSQRILCCQNR